MSEERNDGGPAFPETCSVDFQGTPCSIAFSQARIQSVGGMTLRDWFAGQALAGMAAGDYWNENFQSGHCIYVDDAAKAAYAAADAMLKARDK